MIESVFRLLFHQGDAITEKEFRALLGRSGHEELETIKVLLETDSRFFSQKRGHWALAPLEQLVPNRPIRNTMLVVIDIETTGPIRGKDKIIDFAAVKVKNGEILDRFEYLVNPEMKIPSIIVRLTGIKPEMVKNEATIQEVMPLFLDFLGDNVFVAHDSAFDFSFIHAETVRLGLSPLSNNLDICTFRLAKKLIPKLRLKGLNGLAQHFGYDIRDRHRAMSDVLATNFFLDRFLELAAEKGIEDLHALLEFQTEKLTPKEFRRRLKKEIAD